MSSSLLTVSLPTPSVPVTTTVLGFGCASLIGPKTRAESLHLLETAYEAGIRHFDVARYYGYGDAEGIVGEFAQNKRDTVTITTKVGLQTLQNVARMKGVINLARKVMRVSPVLRKALGRKGGSMIKKGAFDVQSVRADLETSLAQLRTGHLDFYLLHEGDPEGCDSPGLLEFLREKQAEGIVKAFGVGAAFERVEAVVAERPDFAHVVQFENSALSRDIERVAKSPDRAILTHRALSGNFPHLRDYLTQNESVAKKWSSEVGADVAHTKTLASLMLNYAVHANPGGVVLFSSTRPDAIKENTEAVQGPARFQATSWTLLPNLRPRGPRKTRPRNSNNANQLLKPQ